MLLLDTHVLYWFLRDDVKLPFTIKELISTEQDVFVSILSFWEMAMKSSVGKMELPASIVEIMQAGADIQKLG